MCGLRTWQISITTKLLSRSSSDSSDCSNMSTRNNELRSQEPIRKTRASGMRLNILWVCSVLYARDNCHSWSSIRFLQATQKLQLRQMHLSDHWQCIHICNTNPDSVDGHQGCWPTIFQLFVICRLVWCITQDHFYEYEYDLVSALSAIQWVEGLTFRWFWLAIQHEIQNVVCVALSSQADSVHKLSWVYGSRSQPSKLSFEET